VKFKKGRFVGVALESRRNNDATWESLGIIVSSPYTDARPPLVETMPEIRYYRMRYIEKNNPAGSFSAILQTTTIP
jgi:hypothetical protein